MSFRTSGIRSLIPTGAWIQNFADFGSCWELQCGFALCDLGGRGGPPPHSPGNRSIARGVLVGIASVEEVRLQRKPKGG